MNAAGRESDLFIARNVSFAYAKDAPRVLSEVSVRVPRGQMSAVFGANGSGKSTLVRLLSGILRPLAGEIFFDGARLEDLTPRERARRIAYVPQIVRTVFPFTALEVVLSGRTPHTGSFRFENDGDIAIAQDALAAVDAAHLAARPVTELSGGERQMVALARALAQQPVCLLLDEPSSALDLKHRAVLIRHLRRLRDEQGMTSLVVTHDLSLIDPLFDQAFALRCGQVVAAGKTSDVLQEAVLMDVFDDAQVRARQAFGRTFVWSE